MIYTASKIILLRIISATFSYSYHLKINKILIITEEKEKKQLSPELSKIYLSHGENQQYHKKYFFFAEVKQLTFFFQGRLLYFS